MKLTKNSQKYFDLINNEMGKTLMPKTKADQDKLGQGILDTLTGKEFKPVKTKFSKDAIFLGNKLFRHLAEIHYSLDAISNIVVYINSFPYKKHGISEIAYLKYHIENYLNELYIFKLRLEKYLTLILRSYKKTTKFTTLEKKVVYLNKLINGAFENYTLTRGSHVHQLRYSDEELDRLTSLELFSREEDDFGKLVKSLFQINYRVTRKKWRDRIKKDMKGINKLLDIYFGTLLNLLFEKENIIYPSSIVIKKDS